MQAILIGVVGMNTALRVSKVFACALIGASLFAAGHTAALPKKTQLLIDHNPNLISRISPLRTSCVQGKDCANAAKDLAPATAGEIRAGDAIYAAVCSSCHAAGLLGAPKFGDKAAWAARLGQGINVVYGHAINGLNGKMPARGGNTSLSDAEVKNAVDYMVAQSR